MKKNLKNKLLDTQLTLSLVLEQWKVTTLLQSGILEKGNSSGFVPDRKFYTLFFEDEIYSGLFRKVSIDCINFVLEGKFEEHREYLNNNKEVKILNELSNVLTENRRHYVKDFDLSKVQDINKLPQDAKSLVISKKKILDYLKRENLISNTKYEEFFK